MPFHFYLDPVVDQPNIAGIFYGPVLLAAEEPGPRTDWRPVTLDAGDIRSRMGLPGTPLPYCGIVTSFCSTTEAGVSEERLPRGPRTWISAIWKSIRPRNPSPSRP